MQRWLAALALLVPLSGAQAAASLSGFWFGTQPYDSDASYLLTIRTDGSFQTLHHHCRKGKGLDRIVAGTWALEGDTIIYHVATVGGQIRPRVDTFHLVSLDDKQQSTIWMPRGLSYVARRVDDQFRLPSCDLVS